ncbi:hypothetical protein CesoFtcFv8_019520 [Champsocephalus esox]|uniref:Uncharacterized protein n=1 Tax=Champsocephalus esox TaxID=159716 RepID=A0AAN8BDC5_9TELE|nr:hypothetical protein CesoFtcFv8_019520 [Champsocephalus esox]
MPFIICSQCGSESQWGIKHMALVRAGVSGRGSDTSEGREVREVREEREEREEREVREEREEREERKEREERPGCFD